MITLILLLIAVVAAGALVFLWAQDKEPFFGEVVNYLKRTYKTLVSSPGDPNYATAIVKLDVAMPWLCLGASVLMLVLIFAL